MLMKKSQYKSVMFTISICLSSILLAILVAYACDSLREARDDAARAYHDAQQALIDYESTMVYDTLEDIALGGVGSGIAGKVLGETVKQALKITGAGALGTTLLAIKNAYDEHAELQADVDEKSAAYEAARGDYEACENPPERYTYTDRNGHVYEFSDKESYNRFLSNRGLSTI